MTYKTTQIENGLTYHVYQRGDITEWFYQGLRHREGEPAVISEGGFQAWWKHGRRHRLEGPAIIFEHPMHGLIQEWWYQGQEIHVATQAEFERWLKFRCFE